MESSTCCGEPEQAAVVHIAAASTAAPVFLHFSRAYAPFLMDFSVA